VFVRFAAEANVGNNGNPWDYNANSYAPSQACATCYGDGMTFNASFSAGRNQLTVVNSSSPSVGDNILDVTTPSNLPAGATVGAVSGTSVTLANGATATGSTGNDQLAVIHHGNTSADYVRMWNDVKDLITSYAKNITFIWCPSISYVNDSLPAGGNQAYTSFQSIFPREHGAPNVSVMALDGYSYGQRGCGGCAISTTIFQSSVADLARLSSDPIWLAETATAEPTNQELAAGSVTKAEWLQSLWQEIANPKSPGFNRVVGFSYFNDPGCTEFEFDGPGVNDPCPNWSDPQALTMLQSLVHQADVHTGTG
jgi:hypothetical protein